MTQVEAPAWTPMSAEEREAFDRDGYIVVPSVLSESEIAFAVDRCIAQPGSALAGPIGQHKLEEIRRNAERRLGDRFDIRQFHEQVVAGGTMPWRVLEARLVRWIATQRK